MGGKLDTNSGGKTAADGTLVTLALADLQPFSKHPYKVRDDDAMRDMAESVKQYGVLSPAIARPMLDGGYELIQRRGGESPRLPQPPGARKRPQRKSAKRSDSSCGTGRASA